VEITIFMDDGQGGRHGQSRARHCTRRSCRRGKGRRRCRGKPSRRQRATGAKASQELGPSLRMTNN
jgi:hypothetical protein